MNCRTVADELTRLVDEADPEVVFLCGEVEFRAQTWLPNYRSGWPNGLQSYMPGHARAASTRKRSAKRTSAEFARRRSIEMTDLADRFAAEIGRGSGLAAEGFAAVCAALRDGDVDTLIIGELGDATVVSGAALTTIAPDADALSELGEPVQRVARADEALPLAAITMVRRWFGPTTGSHPRTGLARCCDTSRATGSIVAVRRRSTHEAVH